jgi:hypothetical protein
MCRLFWNLGTSTSWNPQGLCRPLMGFLYFTHWIGAWVGPRAGLERRGKSRPHRDSIPGPSNPQPVAIPTELSRPLQFFCIKRIWNAVVDVNFVSNIYFIPWPKQYLPALYKFLECTGRAEFARTILYTISTPNVIYICSPVWVTTQI